MVMLDDATFRARLATLLSRIGISQRALSAVFGRDPGYVQALLDPTRPSRARPTPDDLVRAADATGTTFVELLEALWGIAPDRLADELATLGVARSAGAHLDTLTAAERREVADYVAFLATRRSAQVRTNQRAETVRPVSGRADS
jgi:transcriptional regulator with XRE-family HTH domain